MSDSEDEGSERREVLQGSYVLRESQPWDDSDEESDEGKQLEEDERNSAPGSPVRRAQEATAPSTPTRESEDNEPRTPMRDLDNVMGIVSPYSSRGSRTPNSVPRGELGAAPRDYLRQLESPMSSASSRSGRGDRNARDDLPGRGDVVENPMGNVEGDDNGGENRNEERALIFGTSVDIYEQMGIFRNFCRTFQADGQDEPLYLRMLEEIYETGKKDFNINCEHLQLHSAETRKLYQNLLFYPVEMIPVLDLVVHEEYLRLLGDDSLHDSARIQVRTFNLHKVSRMRALDPEDLEQMVCLRGMVIRASPVIPDLKQAFFRCTMCNFETEVGIDRGVIQEPKTCEGCSTKLTMRLIHNRSLFSDKQLIKLQESPENIPEGETPHTISIYAYDALVDVAKPGDRVEVTGIFKAVATKKNPMRRVLGSTYKTYVDVIHFQKIDKGSSSTGRDRALNHDIISASERRELGEGVPTEAAHPLSLMSTQEKEDYFQDMATDPNLYEKLAHSVAPSIWELDDIKKGVLLLLFGGTNKEIERSTTMEVRSSHRMRSRGEINILLCGDPGTSKSQILGYVHKLAPRGIYTSGKGSSAVGLTAYVSKDPETKEVVLESGALVLSDQGVCCIDEFDKMSDTTRAILHECMEQQTISVAKAGIIATLNARTSILASANPVESRYNPKLSMVQNIKLPPTLLSRFDLIYLVLDKPDVVSDRRLAKHLVQLYFRQPTAQRATFDRRTLSEYIAYAKKNCTPQISNSAVRKLVQGYVEMRQLGALGGGKKTISATPRQLESLIRLSEARAKVRLASDVEESDVDEALRLMHVATQRSAVDPRTGTIDMDAITTGVGFTDRNLQETLANEILNRLRANYTENGVRLFTLVREMNEHSGEHIPQDQFVRAVQYLADNNHVSYIPQTGQIQVVGG